MSLRTPGPILAPHPPALVISVNLTCGFAPFSNASFAIIYPLSYASAYFAIASIAVSTSASVVNGPIEKRTVPSGKVSSD